MTTSLQNDTAAPSRWRAVLLALALILGLTNIVELMGSLRADYWDHVGLLGLSGTIEHGKLRVNAVAPNAPAALASIQPGDLVTWESPPFGFAPSVLNFERVIDRSLPVVLLVEHGGQARRVSTHSAVPVSTSYFVDYAGQVGTDLVFALVGALMIIRRSGD